MIHYVDNIAKISKTYVHHKFKQIINKQKDVWVAPQMTQLFLLYGHCSYYSIQKL